MQYDGFVSYSHRADRAIARALQRALQQFAKPWYRLRALSIFRDETSLAANPGLWPAVERALEQSKYFILIASEESAKSPWVEKELAWWFRHRSRENLLLVLADGELVWNDEQADFEAVSWRVVPRLLAGKFKDEPLHVDLRWARTEPELSLRDARFRGADSQSCCTAAWGAEG
jgi:hypothetical protein